MKLPSARTCGWCVLLALFLCLAAAPVRAEGPVSFRNDVMAVLSKAGCNLGTCHGNANGKGGLKLSLRGQDPQLDLRVLAHDLFARRTNNLDPDQSLVLLKATLQVPHEGGLRFRPQSAEYAILRSWIARGTLDDAAASPRLERLVVSPREQVLVEPADGVQLDVQAVFSDGSQRDVRSLAVYEPGNRLASVEHDGLVHREGDGETTIMVRYLNRQQPVRLAFVPARPAFVWQDAPEQNYVDQHVYAKLRTLRMNPSELCSDHIFLRRAYLDLLGILPTADDARRFVAEVSPAKRSRLIDELLQRPEFADVWALKWSDLLRNEERTLDKKGVQNFHQWIRASIAEGKPVDQFVRELITARGSTYANPPANYYRANRDPIARAEATAQLFLGTRLQCAKCHNHPFDRWTQDDYYRWAGVFARVQYKVLENNRRDMNDKHEFDGEQIVYLDRTSEVEDPRSGEPVQPKFLGARTPDLAGEDRLEAVAQWLTSPDNGLFARVQVNRIWYHLLGRGIVDPIDDFRATNPSSNPALLDALTRDFIEHDFDLRHVIRTIMSSRTYQHASEPNDTNADDAINFSHAIVRRLSAEQLLDCLSRVTQAPVQFNGFPEGLRAGELPGARPARRRRDSPPLATGDQFLTLFGKPPRLLTCECERSTDTTLGQAVQLISGGTLNGFLTHQDNQLTRLLASGRSPREMIEELYWSALSRPPGEEELTRATAYIEKSSDRRVALEDLTWALLNAKEFLLRN